MGDKFHEMVVVVLALSDSTPELVLSVPELLQAAAVVSDGGLATGAELSSSLFWMARMVSSQISRHWNKQGGGGEVVGRMIRTPPVLPFAGCKITVNVSIVNDVWIKSQDSIFTGQHTSTECNSSGYSGTLEIVTRSNSSWICSDHNYLYMYVYWCPSDVPRWSPAWILVSPALPFVHQFDFCLVKILEEEGRGSLHFKLHCHHHTASAWGCAAT